MKLHLADNLALPAEAVTQTFGILGVRGSGKSNTAVVMAEEMLGAKLPFVVIDPVGSWWGLRSSRNGKGPGLAVAIFGGRHGDVPLERAGGTLLADLVVDERLSCVLDVSEFSEGDKIRFLIDFAERLYRRNQDPLHLFLEEADDYAPQRPFREQARLLRAWENVVRRGRARGLGITMITQRSAALNKNVLTQIETLLVFRTTSPQDRKAIGAWVDYHGQSQELLDSLPGLKDGEAWIWSPHWLGKLLRTRIRLRETFDSAATPKDIAGHRPPASLADVDLQAIQKRMSATIERAKQEDPRELRRQVAELRQQLTHAKAPAPARIEIKKREVEIVKPATVRRLEILTSRLDRAMEQLGTFGKALGGTEREIRNVGTDLLTVLRIRSAAPLVSPRTALIREQQAARPTSRPTAIMVSRSTDPPAGELTRPEQRILDAIAWLEAIGVKAPTQTATAFLASYTADGGAFNNPKGKLRGRGLVAYLPGGRITLTDEGRALARTPEIPLTVEALQEHVLARLPTPEQRILRPLLDAYPKALSAEELAERAGYTPGAGAFNNPKGRLRSLGLIEYPTPGQVAALSLLFLEDRP